MTDKLFDSFIKQKLEHFESEVPLGLWEKIMPEEKRKPKAFWWFNKRAIITAIALISSVATVTYFASRKDISGNTNSSKNTIAANENASKKEGTVAENSVNSITNNNEENKTNSVEENFSTSTINVAKNSESDSKSNQSFVDNSSLINSKKSLENSIDKKEKIVINEKNDKLFNDRLNRVVKNNAKQKHLEKSITKSKTKNLGIDNIVGKTINNANFENALKPQQLQNLNLITKEDVLGKLNTVSNKNIEFKIGNLFGRSEDCPTAKGASRNDFYLEAYASPDYTFRKVISTTNGLDQYLTKKDSVEVLRGGFTLGARISKSITDNLLLKAGIQYSQVNEQFS
ncbi:MAG: hypothetical protein NTZ59_02865, partial [Bacteroidetes bacterium]|nr:hypothetical protein [Bacteroidota bacterium]